MALADERTAGFLGRLGVSAAVLGSVLALFSVGTSAVMTILARNARQVADEPIRRGLAKHDILTPVAQRIAEHEAMIARLRDPVAIGEEKRNLAVLYEELGQTSISFSQFARSEEAYQKCLTLDPDNPKYLGDLAQLYATAAVKQAEAKQRLALLRNSSACWVDAATNTPDAGQKREYQQGAATALFGAAKELTQAGLTNEARRELERARSLAPDGSEVGQQIDTFLNQFGH